MSRTSALIRTATCRVAHGLHEGTGEQLTARHLAQRVGWLSSLVAEVGQATIDAHWDRASVVALTSDTTPTGAKLSNQGFTACRQLWGAPGSPQAPPVRHAWPAWGTNWPRANSAQPPTA